MLTRNIIRLGGSKTNKKMFSIGVIFLLIGVLFIHSASSQESVSSSMTKKEGRYCVSPLFQTRLLQVVQRMTRTFQAHFIRQDRITIPLPLLGQINNLLPGSYTSYSTGACVHPTECPCITSGEFCKGGESTRGFNCK